MSNTNTNLPTQTSSVLYNDTVSLCSSSKVHKKTQLSKEQSMKSLRAIQSQFKFLIDTLQDFGTMPIFKRTFAQDLDLLEQHLTKETISQTDCKTILTKLRTTFKNAFNSEFKERMQKYTRFDAQSFKDAMICNMDSIGKYMLEIILHQQRTPHLLKQKKLMQTQEDHSNPIPALNVDSLKVDLVVIQNTCSEKEDSNSETASSKSVKESILDSATKDVHAIKYKMSKAKERCMAYFRSLHSHLQVLSKEDLKGTRIEHGFKRAFMSLFGQDVDTFTSTMLLNVDQLQKQLDKDEFQEDGSMAAFWVVNNQFQKFIDSQFTLDYDSQMTNKYFVKYTEIEVKHFRDTLLQHMGNVKKSVAERTCHQRQTDSTVQDESSRSGNDTDADDADIRPIYDEEPMAEVQLTAECNIFAIGQQHTEQPEIINEGRVDQYPEQCQVKSPMLDSSPDNQTTDYSKQSLESGNILLKKTEKVFAIAALKNDLRKLKGNSVDTKFAKTSVLGKPVLQLLRNQSVVRQPNAFKSERPQMSKPRFASQVDVNNNLSRRPVTQHYLPKRRESVFAKPDHMIASSSSKNSSKNMPRFSSNDMVHNYYQEKARKKTQERNRNSKSSVMHTANPRNITKGSKPKHRSNNQTSRSLPVSKSSCVTITVVPKTDHSKNSSSFLDSKHFVCSICHKCVFSANHDACITKLMEEVNSRAKIQSHKTRNSNKPVDQKSHTQKPSRQIFTRHKIFKSVGLRWIPTGKSFDSCTSKVDSEPIHGSNVDIPNIHENKQTMNLSADTSINVQKEQSLDLSAGTLCNVNKENLRVQASHHNVNKSSYDRYDRVGKSIRSLFDEYFNGVNLVVSKSSVVTAADAPDKRQQQPDSISSTSTLATTVTADGNFDGSVRFSALTLEIEEKSSIMFRISNLGEHA
ncbi:hypothetical protein Tco_0424285 [Tanacetum coccineum]